MLEKFTFTPKHFFRLEKPTDKTALDSTKDQEICDDN